MSEGRKEMFYLRLYGRERERDVLFNDALNTFYLRLYGVRHMVKDHFDSEKGNPLPPHRLPLSINSKGFYMHHATDRITHTTAFVTPVVEHWLRTRNSSILKTRAITLYTDVPTKRFTQLITQRRFVCY